MATQQGFPQVTSPLVDLNTGRIDQAWLQLLISLWNRTGGGSGDFIVSDQIVLDLAFQDGQDAEPVRQDFFAEVSENLPLPVDPFEQGENIQITLQDFFSGDEQQPPALPPAMDEDTPPVVWPIETITVGASPFTFTANLSGQLLITGGTVSQIDLDRKGTSVTTGLTAGLLPLAEFDQCIVTYTVLPTIYFIPR